MESSETNDKSSETTTTKKGGIFENFNTYKVLVYVIIVVVLIIILGLGYKIYKKRKKNKKKGKGSKEGYVENTERDDPQGDWDVNSRVKKIMRLQERILQSRQY